MVDELSTYTVNKWPAGLEVWCNLKGMYTHIVADLTEVIANGNYPNKASMCALGVIGTFYKRLAEFATSYSVLAGGVLTIDIPDIVSEFETGT